ncbi:hypothetical protein BGZ68_003942, partial [Mortierella alpina]
MAKLGDEHLLDTKYFDSILRLRTSLIALLEGNYSFEYIRKQEPDFTEQRSVITKEDKGDRNDDGDGDDDDDDDNGDGDDDDCAPLPLESEGDFIFIRSSLHTLYQQYSLAMSKNKYMLPKDRISQLVLRYKGNELPGFILFTTFTQIYMETLVRWNEMTKAHISNLHQFLHKAITRFVTFTADPLIKDTLLLEFNKFYTSQITKIESEIDNIFSDESTPFTMNKYYYDNIVYGAMS